MSLVIFLLLFMISSYEFSLTVIGSDSDNVKDDVAEAVHVASCSNILFRVLQQLRGTRISLSWGPVHKLTV